MTATQDQRRREVCKELGICYDSVMFSGVMKTQLDRLIALRQEIPFEVEVNIRIIESAFARHARRAE
jgi:hypothetical protein